MRRTDVSHEDSGPLRRLIIDTDTASDDAVAIMMALAHTEVIVEAITVVAGNVPLAQASANARFTLETCRADVPVFEGCDRPWLREAATAEWFHGDDGMGNRHYPAPTRAAESEHAVDALVRLCRAQPGTFTLVTLGPLTNIATALAMAPDIASLVEHCYVMGGAACTHGNVTPAAEYNIWCDPEAARRVLHSGMPLTLIGWELSCGEATLSDEEMRRIADYDTPRARLALDSNAVALRAARELQGQTGLALADPVAMAVALDDTIAVERARCFVDVATAEDATRGMTVVDRLGVTDRTPNATVCFRIDPPRWKELLSKSLR